MISKRCQQMVAMARHGKENRAPGVENEERSHGLLSRRKLFRDIQTNSVEDDRPSDKDENENMLAPFEEEWNKLSMSGNKRDGLEADASIEVAVPHPSVQQATCSSSAEKMASPLGRKLTQSPVSAHPLHHSTPNAGSSAIYVYSTPVTQDPWMSTKTDTPPTNPWLASSTPSSTELIISPSSFNFLTESLDLLDHFYSPTFSRPQAFDPLTMEIESHNLCNLDTWAEGIQPLCETSHLQSTTSSPKQTPGIQLENPWLQHIQQPADPPCHQTCRTAAEADVFQVQPHEKRPRTSLDVVDTEPCQQLNKNSTNSLQTHHDHSVYAANPQKYPSTIIINNSCQPAENALQITCSQCPHLHEENDVVSDQPTERPEQNHMTKSTNIPRAENATEDCQPAEKSSETTCTQSPDQHDENVPSDQPKEQPENNYITKSSDMPPAEIPNDELQIEHHDQEELQIEHNDQLGEECNLNTIHHEQPELTIRVDLEVTGEHGNDPTPHQHPRKGKGATAAKKEAKFKKNSGESYISTTGQMKAPKTPKPVDCSKCIHRCTEKISDEEQLAVNTSYWSLADYGRQRDFICRSVLSQEVRFRKPKPDGAKWMRNVSYRYTLSITKNGTQENITVCKPFFLATLNIGEKTVHGGKRNEIDSHAKLDARGKHSPHHKISQETLRSIKQHIESFPTMESHYCRKKTTKKYLPHELNVTKMYNAYLELPRVRNDSSLNVEISTFRRIFHKYDPPFGFHRPKKDQCLLCAKFTNATAEEKEMMNEEMTLHMENKRLSRQDKENDKVRAASDLQFKSYTFDLQAVLYTPSSEISNFYYARKFCTYNFTLYDQHTKDGDCYYWNETEGKRGSDEIGSCLLQHLSALPETVKSVSFFSDSCGGQNRNRFIASLLHYAVQTLPVESIDLKFLEKGHTDMECDSMHSTIEREKKNGDVYSPEEWPTIFRRARKKQPYSIHLMLHSDFYDLKDLKEKTINGHMSKASDGSNVNWMKIKLLRFQKDKPGSIFFKTAHSEDTYREIVVQPPKKRASGNRGRSQKFQLKAKYNSSLKISDAKKKDLLGLCSSGAIPRQYHNFWNSLTSQSMPDRLPEPDADESDDDEENDGDTLDNMQNICWMSISAHDLHSRQSMLKKNCKSIYFPPCKAGKMQQKLVL